MKKKTQKDSLSAGNVAAVGAGVVALAAASYYFFGPEGKKNRNSLKGWMIKMKGEIVEKMEDAKDLTEDVYAKIVDVVAAKYAKAGKVSEMEIRMFSDMLKSQWKGITKAHAKSSSAKKAPAKKAASAAKSAVKKVAKSAVKKAAKKASK